MAYIQVKKTDSTSSSNTTSSRNTTNQLSCIFPIEVIVKHTLWIVISGLIVLNITNLNIKSICVSVVMVKYLTQIQMAVMLMIMVKIWEHVLMMKQEKQFYATIITTKDQLIKLIANGQAGVHVPRPVDMGKKLDIFCRRQKMEVWNAKVE